MKILFDRDMKGIFILQIDGDYINQQDTGALEFSSRPTVVKTPDLLKGEQSTVLYPKTHNETEALHDVNDKQGEGSEI